MKSFCTIHREKFDLLKEEKLNDTYVPMYIAYTIVCVCACVHTTCACCKHVRLLSNWMLTNDINSHLYLSEWK